MNIIFDLFSSQPFSPFAKFNGGGQYVKSIFKHFIVENQYYNNKIYCTYDSNFYIDDEISSLCQKHNIELLDISVFNINYYISIYNIQKVFIGILQRYLNLELPIGVDLIIVVHDMRDLEVLPTKEELFYREIFTRLFNDKSYKNTSEFTVKVWQTKWTDNTDPSGRVQSYWKPN